MSDILKITSVFISGNTILVKPINSSENYYLIYAKLLSIQYNVILNSSDLILLAYLLENKKNEEFTIDYSLKQLLSKGKNINPEAFNNSTRKLVSSTIITKTKFRKYKFTHALIDDFEFKLRINDSVDV